MVNEAIHWARSVFVPINEAFVRAVRTPVFDHQPPEVREFLVLAPRNGSLTGVAYEGGVRFAPAQPSLNGMALERTPRSSDTPARSTSSAARVPGFSTPAPSAAHPWLQVDISSILWISSAG